MTPEEVKDLELRAKTIYEDTMLKVGKAKQFLDHFEAQRTNYVKRVADLKRREKELAHGFKHLKYEELRFEKRVTEAKQLGIGKEG